MFCGRITLCVDSDGAWCCPPPPAPRSTRPHPLTVFIVDAARGQRRTAASLLFDSLKIVVRERHTLKGAGVRVSAVAGLRLSATRNPGSSAVDDTNESGGAPGESGAATGLVDGGGTGRSPPLPPPPAALLEAVGSGVISVSPGGMAVVEHFGRGGGAGGGNPAEDRVTVGGDRGASPGGVAGGTAVPAPAGGGSTQHDASASLWRLRAARRRRQARGDKMRSLVTWAAGQDGAAWSDTRGGVQGGRGSGSRGGGREGSNQGKVESRTGALGGPSATRATSGAGAAAGSGRAEPVTEQGQQQSLGWGVKLQARALALPASFLQKRN